MPSSLLRLLRNGRRKLLSDVLDVGGFFGVDMGGSLTKLVFFYPDAELVDKLLKLAPRERADRQQWDTKVHAINDVAAFILNYERYGETGVRDAHLSFHLRELGGSFHFVRCVGALPAEKRNRR